MAGYSSSNTVRYSPLIIQCVFPALIVGLLGLKGRELVWSVPTREPVSMSIYDPVHYDDVSDMGVLEYNQLLPPSGHLVHLGPDRAPHTVSMFHQLRCLGLLLETYHTPPANRTQGALGTTAHCLNYLRQMLLCRPNAHMESVNVADGRKTRTDKPYDAVCSDWTAVYDAAEANTQAYLAQVCPSVALSERESHAFCQITR